MILDVTLPLGIGNTSWFRVPEWIASTMKVHLASGLLIMSSGGVGLSCSNEGIDNTRTSGSMGMEGSMEPGFRRTPITAISSIGQKDNSTDGSVANETGHCHLIFLKSPERVEMKTFSDSKTLNDRGWDPSEAAMSLTLRLGLQ